MLLTPFPPILLRFLTFIYLFASANAAIIPAPSDPGGDSSNTIFQQVFDLAFSLITYLVVGLVVCGSLVVSLVICGCRAKFKALLFGARDRLVDMFGRVMETPSPFRLNDLRTVPHLPRGHMPAATENV